MGYWTGGGGTCQSFGGMLNDTNGSCIAWSQLWHQVLEAQGITGSQIFTITSNLTTTPGATGFLVKAWNFGSHIRSGADSICSSTKAGDDVQILPAGPCAPDGEAQSKGGVTPTGPVTVCCLP